MSEKWTESVANTAGEIKSAAGRAGAAIHDTARKIGAETSELGEEVYEQGARGARQVSRNVEAQPLAALAIVGAVGFLLGFLVGRASRGASGRHKRLSHRGPTSRTRQPPEP